jgi:hypothetical protein
MASIIGTTHYFQVGQIIQGDSVKCRYLVTAQAHQEVKHSHVQSR